jgi:hypothetical protein
MKEEAVVARKRLLTHPHEAQSSRVETLRDINAKYRRE